MQFLWKYIDYLAGKGLEWTVIAELLFYASAHLIPMAIPLSVLLSAIMTFGALAENYELLAFKTSGVSLLRIMRPLIFTVAIIAVIAFFFANNGVPKANLKFKSLLYDIKEQKPAMDIVEGAFYSGIEGYAIRVNEKDEENDMLYDIMIYDNTEGRGNVMVTRAKEGKMYITEDDRYLILQLKDGRRYHEMYEAQGKVDKTYPHTTLEFEEYEIRFDLSSFNFQRSDEDLWKNSAQMMNISQLSYYIDSTKIEIDKRLDKMERYIAPYFSPLGDTNWVYSKEVYSFHDSVEHYIAISGNVATRPLIERALSQARSVRGSLKSAAGEVKYQLIRQIKGKIEFHRKFTLSIAVFILFFIGAPLGAIIRKGGLGTPVIISTIIFVLFYIVMISGEKLTKQFAIVPEAGMWYPILFIIPFALVLTNRANNDSKITNIGTAIKGLFRRKKRP